MGLPVRSATLCLLLLRQGQAWTPPVLVPKTRANALRMASATTTDAINPTSTVFQGRTDKQVWRPDKQDVERISWGKPAKQKGTGSRGVPHRINQEERVLFDHARNKGYLELVGSGWRSQRRDAPLCNTYRSWCDACAQVSIVVHKSSTGVDDAVVVDISPLRLEEATEFQAVASACMDQRPGGRIVSPGGDNIYDVGHDSDSEHDDNTKLLLDSSAWETRPIYQLPPYCIVWESLSRQEAKQLAKSLASYCGAGDKTRDKKSRKPVGVKHGKGRRHGGYGIG